MKNINLLHSKILLMLAMLAIAALVLVGCSSEFASSMRKFTYPRDFKYTDTSNLRTDMHKMAFQMGLLDKALSKPESQSSNEIELQREQVLSALNQMGRIAAHLKAGNTGANHPFMDDYMQTFVTKIDKARIAASLTKPRYYFAGKVSGGCVNCHTVNR